MSPYLFDYDGMHFYTVELLVQNQLNLNSKNYPLTYQLALFFAKSPGISGPQIAIGPATLRLFL
jgi:hypothetical protein